MPATLFSNQSPMAVQSAVAAPVLSAPSMLKATAGETVPFPVALDGTDGVPARSIIVISGLPHGSRLSSGSPYGETEWNLKPDEIGDVQLVLPNTTGNETNLLIQLVAPNGGVLAATTTILKVTAGAANIPVYPVKTQLIQGQVWDEPNLDAMDEDKRASSREIVPLPTRPTPIASGNVNANWVKSSAFVNLRKGPTSSAAVVGVVAKGIKLRLVGRKRGWVEVTNPATSETGWIYARNVDPAR
jgi:SH3 domain-containing protein